MTALLLALLIANLASYIILGFYPKFYLGLLLFLLSLLFFVFFQIAKNILRYKNKKQSLLHIIGYLFLFLVVTYLSEIRWSLNPFGMLDAYAMWVGKGRMLALSILDGNPIPLWNSYWRMPNYPIGLPLLHADLSLSFSSLNLFFHTVKIPNYLYLILLFFFIIERSLELKQTKLRWGFLVLTGTFLFHPNFLLVISDLCADFPVSVTLAIATYFLIQREKENANYLLILTISLLINLKSEALLLSGLILVFHFFYSYTEKRITKQFVISAFFLLLVFGIPTWYLFAKGSFLSSDFKSVNQSSAQTNFIVERLLSGNLWILVLKFFIKFYISLTKGISFSLLILVLIWGSFNLRVSVLFFFAAISIYTAIFLLTSLDPQIHLEQAYDRIHFQLYLIPFVIFWKFGKDNEEKISEFLTLIESHTQNIWKRITK